ncbi:hypothetical protein CMQ_3670 [Grosmannia clavigera kw1407]|uniref:Uncharacterized protein n=1 Tax=Grosmannia clavigera (strain kw1407 / UAMH 11150) TaxID=655863 RepID=F0X8H6_GROCL|nr:uncharacterized protein CMQ_3670 [Grosmannia clavigera kw1407]EFX05601.1 hypothetical protein CMQ_3670 [Grosmannia clavigera kw1407]
MYGGTNEESTKPLLICLHGGPGMSNRQETSIYSMFETRLRVLIYDARGSGLILNSAWADGVAGAMGALANVIRWEVTATSVNLLQGCHRPIAIKQIETIRVDVDRQKRVWSGTLLDDGDFLDAVVELLLVTAAANPRTSMDTNYCEGVQLQENDSLAAEALDKFSRGQGNTEVVSETETGANVRIYDDSWKLLGLIHPQTFAATQNTAFHDNMPRFQVLDRLCEVQGPFYMPYQGKRTNSAVYC